MGARTLPYRRILLKLSGEALAGNDKTGINPGVLEIIAGEIAELHQMGVQVAMVIGAGNIFRGALGRSLGIGRITGDHMGMLATVINSLAMQNAIEKLGVPARVMCTFEMKEIAEPYIIRKALDHLEHGRVVIAAGGTGHPFFTTDTAASLRAAEISADVLIKATRVDGVYTGDPEKDPSAVRLESATFDEVLKNQLRVMDMTAVSLCMDNRLPIMVLNIFERGALKKAVAGERVGTTIK